MKCTLVSLAAVAFLAATTLCTAQSITGSTEIDVDPNTGMVTATCQTSLDAELTPYYKAAVTCSVYDADNNPVAYGDSADYWDAQAVISFQSYIGTTYTAVGTHRAQALTYVDTAEPQSLPDFSWGMSGWADYYNFSFYQSGPVQTFPRSKLWAGSYAPQLIAQSDIFIGNTTDSKSKFLDIPPIIARAQQDLSATCDQVFSNVIPGYSNGTFFSSLFGTEFHQWPKGTPNAPPSSGDASTRIYEPGRPIDLWPNFYGVNGNLPFPRFQEFVLVHEGIHHFTGWLDSPDPGNPGIGDFTNKFYNSGYRAGSTSGCFTDWINAGCPQVMPPCQF